MKQSIQVSGLYGKNRLLLVDHSFIYHVMGDLQSSLCCSLSVTALQHVKSAILDGELHILHISVVIFQFVGDIDQLIVDLRKSLLDLFDLHRCADTGYNVLALCVHKNLCVELVLSGCRITGKRNSGSGCRSHISECHHLYVNGSSPGIRNIIVAAVYVGTRIIPAAEYGFYSLNQLYLRIIREILSDCVFIFCLELVCQILQILCIQIDVVLNAFFRFLCVNQFLKFALGNFHNDIGEHLNKSSVAVPCPAGIVGFCRQCFYYFFIQSKVQNGIHHARHGGTCAGTDRNQKRILFGSKFLSCDLLHLADVLCNLASDLIVDLPSILIVLCAGLSGNGEALRNGKTKVGHLRKVCALAAEQLAHILVALCEQIDPFSSHSTNSS